MSRRSYRGLMAMPAWGLYNKDGKERIPEGHPNG